MAKSSAPKKSAPKAKASKVAKKASSPKKAKPSPKKAASPAAAMQRSTTLAAAVRLFPMFGRMFEFHLFELISSLQVKSEQPKLRPVSRTKK